MFCVEPTTWATALPVCVRSVAPKTTSVCRAKIEPAAVVARLPAEMTPPAAASVGREVDVDRGGVRGLPLRIPKRSKAIRSSWSSRVVSTKRPRALHFA